MKVFSSIHRNTIKRITASEGISTPFIDVDEQQSILRQFRINDIDVLESYEDSNYEDGILINEFVVVTDNTNQIRLGNLIRDLNKLEVEKNIGYFDEQNDNGFYAKDYHFYHYAD